VKNPKLSILIVNWRSKEYLRRCLETIKTTCGDLALQIVVVDGGSFDGCGEMLAAEFPEVGFVQSQENAGFGRSNNLGFAKVQGEYVLLLNPDTELEAGVIHKLLAALVVSPNHGLVGPRLLNTDRSLQIHCVRSLPTPLNRALDSDLLRKWFPNSSLWGVKDAFRSSTPVVVQAVSGACMLLRSETYRKVGGFSPEFFMYGEDMDLCAKVGRLGLKVIHVPDAVVVHHGGGSSQGQASQFSTEKMREAWEIYFRLNHGAGAVGCYRLLQAISAVTRLMVLCPIALLGTDQLRQTARQSMRKWCHVIFWSFGRSGNSKRPASANSG